MKKLFFSAFMLLSATSWAQDIPAKEKMQGEPSQEMAALRLVNDLIKYGYNQQAALPLVNAVQIMQDTPSQKLEETKTSTSDTKSLDGKKSQVSFDSKQILADAKDFADGDEKLLAMIAQLESNSQESHRGAVGGPKESVDVVYARSNDVFTVNFVGGRLAEVAVSGDGDTDLDLYVYDSNGNLIASDTDYSDDCYVKWYPKWTGRFTIKVVNNGGVANRYYIATN